MKGERKPETGPCQHHETLSIQARRIALGGELLLVGTDLCSVVDWCKGCGALFLDRHRRIDAQAFEAGKAAGFVAGQEWAGY